MRSRARSAAAGAAAALVLALDEPLVFDALRRRAAVDPRKLALVLALGEHLMLYPLCYVVDRRHPRRGNPGIPPLLTNPRAFLQATWRHTLFGLVLGRLAA